MGTYLCEGLVHMTSLCTKFKWEAMVAADVAITGNCPLSCSTFTPGIAIWKLMTALRGEGRFPANTSVSQAQLYISMSYFCRPGRSP